MNEKGKNSERKYSSILVDGYNLAYAIPEIARFIDSDLERVRELLLIKLSSHAIRHHLHITVVFDGQNLGLAGHCGQQGIKVIFSQGEKADRKIKEIAGRLAATDRKKGWLVVTSDFDIRYQVEGLGLKSESSRDFASRLKADELKPGRKSEKRQKRSAPDHGEKKLSPRDREWIYSVFMGEKK